MIKIIWNRDKNIILHLFCWFNLSFLAADIFVAHSINQFEHSSEWVPFYFSTLSFLILPISFLIPEKWNQLKRSVNLVLGFAAIIIGVIGFYLHIHSQFLGQLSLKSLVYTAPLIAPLSYAGVGLLLILNTIKIVRWSKMVLSLSAAGFLGNFILALCDHEQNGFFNAGEWIPVFMAALATGVLIKSVQSDLDQKFHLLAIATMALQILTGLIGFIWHCYANIHSPVDDMYQKFIFGAPIFAPLLFCDLGLLAILGLYDQYQFLQSSPDQ